MKKVLAFLTALTALFCTACDNKQDSISENPPVEDITATTSAADISENTENPEVSDGNTVNSQPDTELKHYTINDFKEIEVKLNVQKTAPPVEFKEYDLSGIEFEAKQSPCTLPENVKIENVCPDAENTANRFKMEYDEYCQRFMKCYDFILGTTENPLILYTAFDGENLYYLGDYDIACPHVSHNFEIFRYNPETGENTCIYEYSDGTEGITMADMTYFDDGLWLITVDNIENEPEIKTYRIDETSGEMKEDIFEKEIYLDYFSDTQSTDYKSMAIVSYSEDSDIRMEKENRKMTAYTDKIKLETGINSCTLVSATDNRMSFLQADAEVSILHTFDFEKMEKYTTQFESSDANRAYQLGNNVLVYYAYNQKCMYFIPELGAGFVLQDIKRVSPPAGAPYYANDSSVSVYNDKLALTNFDIGRQRDLYHEYTVLSGIELFREYTNPLKKLYIFETD